MHVIATAMPKSSFAARPAGMSLLTCPQLPGPPWSRPKTYAAPASVPGSDLPGAPTSTTSPATATAEPKRSPGAASEAVNVASWTQTAPSCRYT